MSPEKSNELIALYPELFSEVHHLKAFSMFGFECGDGWFDLLKECIENIKKVCERTGDETKVAQIKEKFGTLRFYIDAGNDEVYDAIEEAERKSMITCENCGKPGSTRADRPWIQTLCDACNKPHCA